MRISARDQTIKVFELKDVGGSMTEVFDVYDPVTKSLYEINLSRNSLTNNTDLSTSFSAGGVGSVSESIAFTLFK